MPVSIEITRKTRFRQEFAFCKRSNGCQTTHFIHIIINSKVLSTQYSFPKFQFNHPHTHIFTSQIVYHEGNLHLVFIVYVYTVIMIFMQNSEFKNGCSWINLNIIWFPRICLWINSDVTMVYSMALSIVPIQNLPSESDLLWFWCARCNKQFSSFALLAFVSPWKWK